MAKTVSREQVLLVGSERSWHSQELIRASCGRCTIETASFASLQSSIGIEGLAPIDSSHDRVIVRSMPAGSLEQIIFRMDALAVWQSRGALIFNPPRSLEIAIDKYLCLAKLAEHGLPVPETVACQTFDQAIQAYGKLGQDVVVKPLFGGEGRSLMRVNHGDLAERAFRWLEQTQSVIYLQRFIEHPGYDYRLLVIDTEIFAIKRSNRNDWRTNVARGATCERTFPTARHIELAFAATRATQTIIAGVDLIEDRQGNCYVLEVNAVPGWKAVAQQHNIDIAAKIMDVVLG